MGGFVNSMYVRKNGMNAKVRRMNDLEVFIPKREQRVGKFPLDSQQSPQLLDSHHTVECGGQRAVRI